MFHELPISYVILGYIALLLKPEYKDSYHPKFLPATMMFLFDYDIPIRALSGKLYAKLIPVRSASRFYMESPDERYIHFRQLHHMLLIRAYTVIGFCFDLSMYYLHGRFYAYGLALAIPYYLAVNLIVPYCLVKKDVRKLMRMSFRIVTGDVVYTQTKKRLPHWINLTTLMDVFYWLGESPIWYNENGNMLAYILPDGKRLTIRLQSSFRMMPETEDPYVVYRNPAIFMYIDSIQVADD